MLVIVDDKTDMVHLTELTWREFFALGSSVVNTALLSDSPDVHTLIEPLIKGFESANDQVLEHREKRAEQ